MVGCVVSAAEQRSLDLLLLHAAVNEGGGKTICETERKNFRFVSFYFKLSLVSPVFFSPACCARPPLLQTNTHVCVLYTKKQKKSSVTNQCFCNESFNHSVLNYKSVTQMLQLNK